MFQQQAMDEDVTTAYFLQENAIASVVKETGIIPGDITVAIKDEAQGEVLDAGFTTFINQPNIQHIIPNPG
jgi:hypothetical protein